MTLTARIAIASFAFAVSAACRTAPEQAPASAAPLAEAPAPEAGLPNEGAYLLRSTDLRCAVAPCPYYEATAVAAPGGEPIKFHGVELSSLELTAQGREKLEAQLAKGGIRAWGRFEVQKDAGPAGDALVFHVKELRD
jgi:hypothetical protein